MWFMVVFLVCVWQTSPVRHVVAFKSDVCVCRQLWSSVMDQELRPRGQIYWFFLMWLEFHRGLKLRMCHHLNVDPISDDYPAEHLTSFASLTMQVNCQLTHWCYHTEDSSIKIQVEKLHTKMAQSVDWGCLIYSNLCHDAWTNSMQLRRQKPQPLQQDQRIWIVPSTCLVMFEQGSQLSCWSR